ncbi:hypothetical protein PVK06_002891 [Gossypium arboreum]|uniref:Uncharacterized protein n=1 Tax=Gossypium arboreum TaxID=29729 RepID=A0ABR0R4Q6_GOSAR|nr:hypothetical protein PVK06_002891 [Gossypium arboreum]
MLCLGSPDNSGWEMKEDLAMLSLKSGEEVVHDLSVGLMSETMARQFGDFLGHSERSCPARIVHRKKELEFERDLSIKAIPRRAMVASSP